MTKKELLQRKREIEQIANFIVNNITLAEVSAMVIERATETAEFIVINNLDPKNFNSQAGRKKMWKDLRKLKSSGKITPVMKPGTVSHLGFSTKRAKKNK
jgi:nucleoside-triphosphatase THEP1